MLGELKECGSSLQCIWEAVLVIISENCWVLKSVSSRRKTEHLTSALLTQIKRPKKLFIELFLKNRLFLAVEREYQAFLFLS